MFWQPELGQPFKHMVMVHTNRTCFSSSNGRNLIVGEIFEFTKHQPAKLWRTLQAIQATARWCYKRADGRWRAAQEILRQQEAAVIKLETEAALHYLSD
jgi:hypothetical protein